MKCTVIAIDGPAASGKSTISRLLAGRLGFIYLNTGAIYRAATWHILGQGIDPADEQTVSDAVDAAGIRYDLDATGAAIIKVNDRPLSREDLTTPEVNSNVSAVSSYPRVRAALLDRQREFADIANLIAEGRDMGTRVFPASPHKFFVTASEEVRQRRRAAEGITEDVARRDKLDSTRKADPLKPADDAIVIDTSEMSVQEVCETILQQLHRQGLAAPSKGK